MGGCGGGNGGGAVGGVGGVYRVGIGPLSLDGPADASCPDIRTDSDCVSASMMICSCMNRSWLAVYGHVHVWALVLSSWVPRIAMVSAALARRCRRQYAAVLHAASRGDGLHQQSLYVSISYRLGPGHSELLERIPAGSP